MSQSTHAEITDVPPQPPIPEAELDNGTVAGRIGDRRRNAAQVAERVLAERALEEIGRDGAFDYDPSFEHIIEDNTNGFNGNDDPIYEQQQRRPRNSLYSRGGLEKCCDSYHALVIDTELLSF